MEIIGIFASLVTIVASSIYIYNHFLSNRKHKK